jgi:hypothetical protein
MLGSVTNFGIFKYGIQASEALMDRWPGIGNASRLGWLLPGCNRIVAAR